MGPSFSSLLCVGSVQLRLFANFVSLMLDLPLLVLKVEPRLFVLLNSLFVVVNVDSAVFAPFLSSHPNL